MSSQTSAKPRLAVIGGGMAGMAAALAGADAGCQVDLYEQGLLLGGRAGSFLDTTVEQLVDFSPHVSMGCCTYLADFCQRLGVASWFDRYRTLHFYSKQGKRYDFVAASWLPAPLHLLPGLLGLGYLSLADRMKIGRAILRLIRWRQPDAVDAPTMAAWLAAQHQSSAAIEGFWAIVLVSALGDTLEHVSVAAAKKVFLDGFCAHPNAYEVLVPRRPLGSLWREAGEQLANRGVVVHLQTAVDRIVCQGAQATGIVLASSKSSEGQFRAYDYLVLAVSWKQIARLVGDTLAASELFGKEILGSPITAVHLWFDRPITSHTHAALVGKLSQWLFVMQHDEWADAQPPKPFHYAVVISASHALIGRDLGDIRKQVLAELTELWPTVESAKLVHSRVLTQPAAVFSVRPGIERLRPAPATALMNVCLAGDWTSTGWPATMEGAVRSGYRAVAALSLDRKLLAHTHVNDLPRGWLVRLLAGRGDRRAPANGLQKSCNIIHFCGLLLLASAALAKLE